MRKAGWIAVVAFVVIDAVLIAIALRHTRAPEAAADSDIVVVTVTQSGPSEPDPVFGATGRSGAAGGSGAADGSPAAGIDPSGASGGATPTTSRSSPTPSTTAGNPATTGASTTPASTSPATPTSPTTGTSSPTTSASSSSHQGAVPPAAERILLDMSSDGSVIRALRGECPADSPARVEVSDDGGSSWHTVETDSTAILRVGAQRDGLWYVGTDSGCDPIEQDTDDGGATWTTGGTSGAWYLDADPDATTLQGPNAQSDVGCVPVALSGVSLHDAAVACADGTVRVTDDAGASWSTASTVPGVAGISFVSADSGVALAPRGACGAAVLRTSDGGSSWSQVRCLDGYQPLAIAAAGDAIRAQVGTVLYGSDDDGESWEILDGGPQ